MIISVSIENWMSFRDLTTFSMVADEEEARHKDRLAWLTQYQTGVLPVAAIYGGNASGKTHFVKALSFARKLIAKGTQPDSRIAVEPFRLDDSMGQKPSGFVFELLIDALIYEFSFAVTAKEVLEEKLVVINHQDGDGSGDERVLYHRKDGKIDFDPDFAEDAFLQFAFQGTRDNQLFLTNTVSQKVNNFRPVYDWFRNTLEVITSGSHFRSFEHFLDEAHPLYSTMSTMLAKLDTGIARLGEQNIALENISIPPELKAVVQEELEEGRTVRLPDGRCLVSRKSGELVAIKRVACHTKTDGTEALFDIQQESEGAQRVIDLLPAFMELSSTAARKVYVIDELDRSLHPLLTRQLLATWLTECSPETRSQLVFTTHDLLLMDKDLLRCDEIWLTERDASGTSSLASFSDYKEAHDDKNIRKSYLQGRLGGIPRILLADTLIAPDPARDSQEDH